MRLLENPELITLSVGKPRVVSFEVGELYTGIYKKAAKKAYLTKDGLEGDAVGNTNFHGGSDRAVCVYSFEHYSNWEKEFGKQLPPSAFGENLTVSGMLEKDVCIGDIFQIGEAIVQVSQGRIPCRTISLRNAEDTLLGRIVHTGYTGYFFRVLQEGWIHSDSRISLMEPHPKKVSIMFANLILFHEKDNKSAVREILEVDALAEVWRAKLNKRL